MAKRVDFDWVFKDLEKELDLVLGFCLNWTDFVETESIVESGSVLGFEVRAFGRRIKEEERERDAHSSPLMVWM